MSRTDSPQLPLREAQAEESMNASPSSLSCCLLCGHCVSVANTLPRRRPRTTLDATPSRRELAAMKIRIADDKQFYRCALKATLTEWGYDVIAVADGEAAWEVLQGPNPPKLAILDWVMPRADGPEVCRRLRRVPRHEP